MYSFRELVRDSEDRKRIEALKVKYADHILKRMWPKVKDLKSWKSKSLLEHA